jgi:hypothetical protein
MPRRSRPVYNFNQQRFMQISESHCGPAVIQMLLDHLGIAVSQEAIAEEGGATNLIEMNGMRVDQLALAVHRIAPRLAFYFKEHATIEELVRVVNDYRYPAGIEWQGVFDDDDEDDEDEDDDEEDDDEEDDEDDEDSDDRLVDGESEDSDYGHYSLVTRADRRKRQLIITDPYKDYFSQARVFDYAFFDQRWYDFNEIPDPSTGKSVLVKDDHLFFVVVPRTYYFPRRMGMQAFAW